LKSKQKDFFSAKSDFRPNRLEWGGCNKKGVDNRGGKRKLARPFDRRKPIHITMKATKAQGRLSMLSPKRRLAISDLLERKAKASGTKIHKFANVGNHLHLLATFRSREQFQKFMRSFSGEVARLTTGARKGKPFGKFWDALAHTRVIVGLRAYALAERYIFANEIEVKYRYEAREFFRTKLTESFRVRDEDIPDEYRPGAVRSI
jgi:REP element-mobilizing transposase RayT